MVSDFVDTAFCNLLTQNMTLLARATDIEFPNTARVLLEYMVWTKRDTGPVRN